MTSIATQLSFGTRSALLGHQGGWDELLLVGGPVVVIAGLLVLAKRRVDSMAAQTESSRKSTDPTRPGHPRAER